MDSLLNIFEDFFVNSSFHGSRYFSAKSGYHWTERYFWAICCLLSWGGAAALVYCAWQDFDTKPISYVVSTSYLDWNTEFPSVSVCQSSNWEESKLQAKKYFGADYNMNMVEIMNEIAFPSWNIYYMQRDCSANEQSRSKINCSGIDTVKVGRKARNPCKKVLQRCWWRGVEFDCCRHFLKIETEMGYCYCINNIQNRDILRQGSMLDLSSNFSTGPGALILQPTKPAIKVYVHSRADVPYANNKGLEITEIGIYEVSLALQETHNAPEVHRVSPVKRGCRFPEEKIPSMLYQYYSYSSCIVQCRMRAQLEVCNCTTHLFLETQDTACDVDGILCIYKHFEKVFSIGSPFDKRKLVCHCAPGCDDVHISILAIMRLKSVNNTYIKLMLEHLPSEKFERCIVHSLLDLVVSMGSATALFVGASILSYIELLYYLVSCLHGARSISTP